MSSQIFDRVLTRPQLLKSFIGTGCLFLGKAFFNGGMLFSTLMLCFVSGVSLWSFLLLIQARNAVHGSFGDIGGKLYGPVMRKAILTSITVSQLGFVAAYIIFIAENLRAFALAVSADKSHVTVTQLIFLQLLFFLPMSLYRDLSKLAFTALVADAFILVGLVYIFGTEISIISTQGVADIVHWNPKSYPLLIGTAVFAFEGIGLIIPITEAMKEPERFPRVLCYSMAGITALFVAAGALGYAAYGSAIQTVVISNLPTDTKPVQAVQFLYSIAILLSAPVRFAN